MSRKLNLGNIVVEAVVLDDELGEPGHSVRLTIQGSPHSFVLLLSKPEARELGRFLEDLGIPRTSRTVTPTSAPAVTKC